MNKTEKSRKSGNIGKTKSTLSQSATKSSLLPNPIFPLKFIEIPVKAFNIHELSDRPEVHYEYKKKIETILKDYKFHSFTQSSNRGNIILCFIA